MRVIVQRVLSAQVEVDGEVTGAIGPGLLVLAGMEKSDGSDDLVWMSSKLSRLRIFPDASGIMNCSVVDIQGEMLAVSQFTLFASVHKGNRPSWQRAASTDISRPLFDCFVQQLEVDLGCSVPTGVFGADMKVHLVNDGPVTLFIDSKSRE